MIELLGWIILGLICGEIGFRISQLVKWLRDRRSAEVFLAPLPPDPHSMMSASHPLQAAAHGRRCDAGEYDCPDCGARPPAPHIGCRWAK